MSEVVAEPEKSSVLKWEQDARDQIRAALRKIDIQAAVKTGLNKALEAQYPLAVENVARLRRVNPGKSPAELISYLNAIYLSAVTTTGAGAGAAAIVPNGWVQVPVAIVDLITFLEASVLYTL